MIFGQHDENTLEQFRDCASRAKYAALMADGHLGYVMPIGGVMAYENMVSVPGVGFDIACGNAAIKTNFNTGHLSGYKDLYDLADEIQDVLSFGMGGTNKAKDAPKDHSIFYDLRWLVIPARFREPLINKARSQLGTVGAGNHYVDIFHDEEGWLWVGVHFGSRGLGHTIASNFLALGSGAAWGDRVKESEVLLDLDTSIGKDYWDLMNLSGQYAYAGRNWVVQKVAQLMGAEIKDLVHNHHNFAWKENHGGEDLIVIRKGATPAFPGQRGFVGGSMGDQAVILEGYTEPTPFGGTNFEIRTEKSAREMQIDALFSTVHGAGRVMSRTQAKGKKNKAGEVKQEPQVTPAMMREWVTEKKVILRGGGVDESPHVYRRLPEVLAAQGPTIKVLHTLTPLIVIMAPGAKGRW
jgi:tRNA-splicing ligase RtcB